MLTFITQAATGLSRLFVTSTWGRNLNNFFGGYDTSIRIHRWVGFAMIVGFLIHCVYLLAKVNWRNLKETILGPDSLILTHRDALHLGQRILWFFGIGAPPKLDRWSYWEKFDYWAVFWGLPLLAVTGIMLIYPMETSRYLPGWSLNVAALLHRAEAILALSYIFIVHFFIGHFRPTAFPMNKAMFEGTVHIDEAEMEKPAWVERMKAEGRLEPARKSSIAFRVLYYLFGYTVVAIGVYLLVGGIANLGHITF